MTIIELFVASNEAEQEVVEQIAVDQWGLMMQEKITRRPMGLMEVAASAKCRSVWFTGEVLEQAAALVARQRGGD